MTLPEFFAMPLPRQCRMLYLHGEFVMAIRYYRHKVNLYLLNGEYLEVFYNHKQGIIEAIRPLDTTSKRMNFYADQVKLKSLGSFQDGR